MSLPEGKTPAEALARAKAQRNYLWQSRDWADVPEDEKIVALTAFCVGLHQGDTAAGEALARDAVWS